MTEKEAEIIGRRITSLTLSLSNLNDAAKYDQHQRIKAYSVDERGDTVVVSSRHHSMNVRNILYGGRGL